MLSHYKLVDDEPKKVRIQEFLQEENELNDHADLLIVNSFKNYLQNIFQEIGVPLEIIRLIAQEIEQANEATISLFGSKKIQKVFIQMSAQFFELHPLIIFPQLFSIIEQTATPMKFRFLWIFIQIIDQNEIESEIPLRLIEEAIQYLINCVKECNAAMNIFEILLSIMIYFLSANYDLFFSLTSKFRLYKSLADLLQKENSFKTIELWLILVTLIMSNLYDGFLPILLCYEVIIRLKKKIKSDLNMEQANLIDVILDKADKMGSIEKSDGNAN